MSEEPIGDFMMRIHQECLAEVGPMVMFWMWCQGNYPEIAQEFIDYNQMMTEDINQTSLNDFDPSNGG
jgi:hypothetical protein